MAYLYEELGLWARGFNGNVHQDAAQRLREAYRAFWDRGCELAAKIAVDLPGLTLHDQEHFLALWSRADQIAGSDYALNPMELFLFGGAILLHDAGHTLSAYPRGLSDLKDSTEWKDTLAQMQQSYEESIERSSLVEQAEAVSPSEEGVLFAVLRKLHAKRSETLGFLQVPRPDNLGSVSLLEDDSLRTHFGKTIGLIAASHHWDASEIERRLPKKIGALAKYPSTWTVRPRILAYLLRAADACQVDQTRAPDFSYALLRSRRSSELHWRAQNRLTQPYVENRKLAFTSTRPFEKSDAKAWWLITDALVQAHMELVQCNRLLVEQGEPSFEVTGVSGADEQEGLSKYIIAEGWEPVTVGSKISDPKAVITLLGGQLLYEDAGLAVPLREMIQNASDAVRARRALEDSNPDFAGKVMIEVSDAIDGFRVLTISDNGIGMSTAVLKGALLDFGRSLWRSSEITDVFPGLATKKVQQGGRYGIGFFSLMMVTRELQVTSRPYDVGVKDARRLHFPDGVVGPCIMYTAEPGDASTSFNTTVKFRVTEKIYDEFLSILDYAYDESGDYKQKVVDKISFPDRVDILCSTLDCDIFVKEGSCSILAHSQSWFDEEASAWFKKLFGSRGLTRYKADYLEDLGSIFSRVAENIVIDGKIVGRAAISFADITGGDFTLHGFSTEAALNNRYLPDFLGIMPAKPAGPRRKSREPAMNKLQLAGWATNQAERYSALNLDGRSAYQVSCRVCRYGGDSTAIANILVNGEFIAIKNVADYLISGHKMLVSFDAEGFGSDRAFKRIGTIGGASGHSIAKEFPLVFSLHDNVKVITAASSSMHDKYLEWRDTENPNFYKLLSGILGGLGFNLVEELIARRQIGHFCSAPRLGVVVGDPLLFNGAEISARRAALD
jgi:hypothetical protein